MKIQPVLIVFCSLLILFGCGQNKDKPSKQQRNLWLEERIERWKNGDEDQRWNALGDIAQEGIFNISKKDSFALPFLHERFKAGDEAERETAMGAMGLINDPASLPYIKEGLKDESFFVRKKAVWALSRFDDSEKTALIIPLLDDKNDLVRQQAANVLKPLVTDEKIKKRIAAVLNNLPMVTIEVKNPQDPQEVGKAVSDALREQAHQGENQRKAEKAE